MIGPEAWLAWRAGLPPAAGWADISAQRGPTKRNMRSVLAAVQGNRCAAEGARWLWDYPQRRPAFTDRELTDAELAAFRDLDLPPLESGTRDLRPAARRRRRYGPPVTIEEAGAALRRLDEPAT